MTATVSATKPITTEELRDPHVAAAPTACPSWCALGAPGSAEHDGGPRVVAHRSAEAVLAGPADSYGLATLVRAELFALDEEGEAPGGTALCVSGETYVELTSVEQVDALIADIGQFFVSLWRLRMRMVNGRWPS